MLDLVTVRNTSTTSFHRDNIIPTGDWVWVFGSNEAGRHGKGAAKIARVNFRAEYGVGRGPTGHAYAIPTKDKHLNVLPLESIQAEIDAFLDYARANPKVNFFVTAVGCGLAGYSSDVIGPKFAEAPANCSLPDIWKPYVLASLPKPQHKSEKQPLLPFA